MAKTNVIFALLAAGIALASNAVILEDQGNLIFHSLATKSAMPMVLAICPFVLGANLIEKQASVLFGSVFGIGMTALLWGFAILISVGTQPELDQDTGPFMLLLAMPFIVTSVFLVTALLKERLASR